MKQEDTNGESSTEGQALDERLNEETGVVIDALLTRGMDLRRGSQRLTRDIAACADAIAQELGLGVGDRNVLQKAAALRDVSKPGVSDDILLKSGPLTAREFAEIRTRLVPEPDEEDSPEVREAIRIARHHHERVDGQGYPDQLKGSDIPLGSRILAAAEAYETMLVPVSYRPARTPEEAMAEILEGAGSQYDRVVVEALGRSLLSQPRSRPR